MEKADNPEEINYSSHHGIRASSNFLHESPHVDDADATTARINTNNGIIASPPPQSILPTPSTEQRAVINAVLEGNCVTIPSVAGSGKTTCMLQIAAALPLHRHAIIITYNRSLKDECVTRIHACGLSTRVSCYTIHGLISRVAGRVCNDDSKLNSVAQEWDRDGRSLGKARPFGMDLVLLDEAQDLRPSFYRALCHVMEMCLHYRGRASSGANGVEQTTLQICLVGDPNQMLYDFPTYGSDKASTRYMMEPQKHWGQFTKHRAWTKRKLSVSYRLTPNIAAFVNVIWGTGIVGGNTRTENLPVDYVCKYPFPYKYGSDPNFLSTKYLQGLIDEYEPENTLFLAQSVKNKNCPIRVHVNELLKIQDGNGQRLYNFHIKESFRGFEGKADLRNKVRVWTFCGSKGIEADCVVIFGFDGDYLASLNQMCVALSRARKRLVVIHGKKYTGRGLCPNKYYPLLGEKEEGMKHSIVWNGRVLSVDVPPCKGGDLESSRIRSRQTRALLSTLEKNKAICTKLEGMPKIKDTATVVKHSVAWYVASEFSFFAALEEHYFLSYGMWTQEKQIADRIEYNISVQFDKIAEDVSALYGEALVYMLQWEKEGYCPNVETVINDGILQFNPTEWYQEDVLRTLIFAQKNCEPMPPGMDTAFSAAVRAEEKGIMGKDLIRLLNTRIRIQKRRVDGERIIFFRIKAMETRELDEKMKPFLAKIRSIYEATEKTPAIWLFIANAVMAYDTYHEKWNQIGTEPESYERWAEAHALEKGLSRLRELMKSVPPSQENTLKQEDGTHMELSSFEHELIYDFEEDEIICKPPNNLNIQGVQGICDWVGSGLSSPSGTLVDLLEIKFTSELGNENRLQIMTYAALLAVERNKTSVGMLYNARTEEMEICQIEPQRAKDFLIDTSWFKYDGTKRYSRKLDGVVIKSDTEKTLCQRQTQINRTSISNPLNDTKISMSCTTNEATVANVISMVENQLQKRSLHTSVHREDEQNKRCKYRNDIMRSQGSDEFIRGPSSAFSCISSIVAEEESPMFGTPSTARFQNQTEWIDLTSPDSVCKQQLRMVDLTAGHSDDDSNC
uniref:DNA helicase n=1 Tax=Ditylum brightwellii TaxID=49249 RepID=A0A7S4QXW9_9STRA